MLLKLREAPNSDSGESYPPMELATETWDGDSQTEPNCSSISEKDLILNE